MYYEHRKHDGSLPIVGVNTFLPEAPEHSATQIPLARGSEEEKGSQLDRLRAFTERNAGGREKMLARLRDAVIRDENVFEVLMDAVRVCSLGQITETFFEVGGRYRRSM